MRKFNKNITAGTNVEIKGKSGLHAIESVHETRKWITVAGLRGSFQRGHVVRFTNKTESKMTNEKTYLEMYTDAMEQTGGHYRGYTDGNALSLYVDEKFDVNAAANSEAHDALVEVLNN